MGPESLRDKFPRGRIDGSTAIFGAPSFGERVLGRLVYGESKLSSHCDEEDYSVPDPSPGQDGEVLPNIIMVRRGRCSAVRKVLVAIKKGAHAVVIVDSEDSLKTSRDIRRMIVPDDGGGASIAIPTLFIAKDEGRLLIESAKSSVVHVELVWDTHINDVAVLDLWMSSGSRRSMRFLRDFAGKRRRLDSAIEFVPHFNVFGLESSATDVNDLCIDDARRFCTEDPDGNGPVTGKMVLEEDTRQMCIHDLTKAHQDSNPQTSYSEKYWSYVEQLPLACPFEASGPGRFGRTCSANLTSHLGIDAPELDKCMSDTMDSKLQQQKQQKAWSPHAVRISGWKFVGRLDTDLVTEAICAGFLIKPLGCATETELLRDKVQAAIGELNASLLALQASLHQTATEQAQVATALRGRVDALDKNMVLILNATETLKADVKNTNAQLQLKSNAANLTAMERSSAMEQAALAQRVQELQENLTALASDHVSTADVVANLHSQLVWMMLLLGCLAPPLLALGCTPQFARLTNRFRVGPNAAFTDRELQETILQSANGEPETPPGFAHLPG